MPVKIHDIVAPVFSLPSLIVQIEDISNDSSIFENVSINEIILKSSKSAESRINFMDLTTVLVKIATRTPPSADIESFNSANNILKKKVRLFFPYRKVDCIFIVELKSQD